MKILKIDPKNPQQKIIDQTVSYFKKGAVVVYPTDTCYGIGADLHNKIAFNKIYKIKKRPKTKPFSVIVPDIKTIYNLAIVNKNQEKYIKNYFPGSVTLIFLTLDEEIFPFSSIGIRMPNYIITKLISEKLKNPYITTSANISNYPPAYEVNDFLNQLEKNDIKPDLILDAGKLSKNLPSTVVDLTKNTPHTIRQGSVNFKI